MPGRFSEYDRIWRPGAPAPDSADLTQEQLAQLTGLSVRSIGDLERGVTGEPRRSTRRLLEAGVKLPEPMAEKADDSGERIPSAQMCRACPPPCAISLGVQPSWPLSPACSMRLETRSAWW